MPKRKRSSKPPRVGHLHYNPTNPLEFMDKYGYVVLKRAVPVELCDNACVRVRDEMTKSLEKTAHQEQPVEFFSLETKQALEDVQTWVVDNVLRKLFDPETFVADGWEETLYGRLKRQGTFTKPHCDALNTVVERRLLCDEQVKRKYEGQGACCRPRACCFDWRDVDWGGGASDNLDQGSLVRDMWASPPCRAGTQQDESGQHAGTQQDESGQREQDESGRREQNHRVCNRAFFMSLPIYTFWISLEDMDSLDQSHLQIHPTSHRLPGQRVVRHKTTQTPIRVGPAQYKPVPKKFLSPDTPYKRGDLVIFHALTQHRANVHKMRKGEPLRERVSMDGRVFMNPGFE